MSDSYTWWVQRGSVFIGTSEQHPPFPAASYTTRSLHQVHGARVLDDAAYVSTADEADGLVTDRSNIALIIRTADCVPVLATDGCRIAAFHAGWRGTRAGVVAHLNRYVQPERSSVLIGPAICPACYEVGPDLFSAWLAEAPRLADFLHPGNHPSKRQFDLVGFITHQLRRQGFQDIRRQPGCTYGSSLPSYRREGQLAGRLKHFIVRSQEPPPLFDHQPIRWSDLPPITVGSATRCRG